MLQQAKQVALGLQKIKGTQLTCLPGNGIGAGLGMYRHFTRYAAAGGGGCCLPECQSQIRALGTGGVGRRSLIWAIVIGVLREQLISTREGWRIQQAAARIRGVIRGTVRSLGTVWCAAMNNERRLRAAAS